jgi:hypothetical protein
VWVSRLTTRPADHCRVHSLFEGPGGDRRIPRARGPGFAFLEPGDIPEMDRWQAARVPKGALDGVPDLRNAELVIIPVYTWTMNILPVESYDPSRGIVRTTVPCTYRLEPNRRAASVWLENSLTLLRSPGTWAADWTAGELWYWPESGAEPGELHLPVLSELIRLEGEIDHGKPEDRAVRNVELHGIQFRHGARHQFHGQTGWGLQHDWEAFDRPTAMLRLRGAEDCAVSRCRFSCSDGAGLRMDLHCRGNTVARSTFEDLGGCGLLLHGYGPGTKDSNRGNRVLGNVIRHVGKVVWHSPAVFLWQSGGNQIAHNRIHNAPYTGIVVSGRIRLNKRPAGPEHATAPARGPLPGTEQWYPVDPRPGFTECYNTIRWSEVDAVLGPDYRMPAWHQAWKPDWDRRKGLLHCRNNVIEYNDIHDVMETMGDGNGVYISGTGAGNVVRYNRVHDCPSPTMAEALRCDDDQHETVFHGNVIYRMGGMATGMTIKGINTLTNNVVADPLAEKTARGLVSLEVGPLHGSVVRSNILVTSTPAQAFYAQRRLTVHGTGSAPLLRDCDADCNLYWCTDDPDRAHEHLREERRYGIETHSAVADPLFVDTAAGDYRLRPDSPAHELGFERMPIEKIGPEGLEA